MSKGFVKVDGIDALFADIRKKLADAPQLIIKNLAFIGEEAVKYARLNHPDNWKDQTGNLRSSIGYVVLHDGHPVTPYNTEQKAGPKGDGHEGVTLATETLQKIASEFPKGYTLIVVAGMNYASYVEDIHNRDVLTGARLKAQELVHKLLED